MVAHGRPRAWSWSAMIDHGPVNGRAWIRPWRRPRPFQLKCNTHTRRRICPPAYGWNVCRPEHRKRQPYYCYVRTSIEVNRLEVEQSLSGRSGGKRPGHCLLNLMRSISPSRPKATVRHKPLSLTIDLDTKTRKHEKKNAWKNQPRFLHQTLQQPRKKLCERPDQRGR